MRNQPFKPIGQNVGGNALGRRFELLESRSPQHQIANDKQRPLVTKDVERARDRTDRTPRFHGFLFSATFLLHFLDYTRNTFKPQVFNFGNASKMAAASTFQSQPKLDKPGAGLPAIELLVARAMFAVKRRITTSAQATDQFASEQSLILQLAKKSSPEAASRPVLIDRIRGIEDSSRFWSIYMTIDHLNIVNEAISGAIGALVAGHVPPTATSTADVKPSPETGGEVLDRFETVCSRYLHSIESHSNLKTEHRYPHPWFGPMNAAEWHQLAAFHMALHRRQIEKILAKL